MLVWRTACELLIELKPEFKVKWNPLVGIFFCMKLWLARAMVYYDPLIGIKLFWNSLYSIEAYVKLKISDDLKRLCIIYKIIHNLQEKKQTCLNNNQPSMMTLNNLHHIANSSCIIFCLRSRPGYEIFGKNIYLLLLHWHRKISFIRGCQEICSLVKLS